MLKIEGRTFMNIQEAVQWLLDNNVLPFQSTANYQANTEIGLGTIVNPTPAKVRIGSLIFFADSKVSTVVGITDTGFICSDKYNNLVDDIAYVTNITINASGHLITTLSDGQTIDAGLIKQVSSISINSSQHLIVSYNDGSSVDIGSLGDFSNADFLVKTISQTEANWSGTPYISGDAGIPATIIYNRFEVIGNILYVVLNFKLVNNTGSEKTVYALEGIIAVPQIYSEKIIDFEGDNATVAKATRAIICAGKGQAFDDLQSTYFDDINVSISNHTIANYVRIDLTSTGITIANGATKYITARLFLTLL